MAESSLFVASQLQNVVHRYLVVLEKTLDAMLPTKQLDAADVRANYDSLCGTKSLMVSALAGIGELLAKTSEEAGSNAQDQLSARDLALIEMFVQRMKSFEHNV